MNKNALRKFFAERRASLSNEELEGACFRIGEQLRSAIDFADISFLHHFISINREVDTSVALSGVLSDYPLIQRVAPRVNKLENHLEHLLIDDASVLIKSKWGIPEPSGTELIAEKLMDIVIVPLFCFDRHGHRVGYGGGFYDRFLAKCRADCLKIGVSHFGPIDQILDIHTGDVQLDYCITAEKVYDFTASCEQ